MDYKKIYTPTEATAIYNTSKIKFDPTSYSLKGNLILNCDIEQLTKEHIHYFDFRAESQLLMAISENEPKRKPSKTLTGKSGTLVRSLIPSYNQWAMMCVQQDNLYVSLELLARLTALEHIKHTNVLQTVVSMCVALNSAKSCAKDLIWASLTPYEPYNKVHTFEILKDALKDPEAGIPLLSSSSSIDSTFVPANDTAELGMPMPFERPMDLTKDTLYAYILSSFEMLWAWNKLAAPYKDCFVELCNRAHENTKFDTALFEKFFKFDGKRFEISEELERAISIDSPEERYAEYKRIAESGKAYEITDNYYHYAIPAGNLINSVIAAYASFITQIGISNTRVNTIRILHEYCVAHKYLKDLPASEDGGIASKFGASLGTMSGTPEPSKGLIDFDTPKYCGKASDTEDGSDSEGVHDTSAMFEALDSLKSSFTSGKYRFTTKDVRDTDDSSRARYMAIASKVETVNKLLIRKIKDIKTYNTGGKNSGMPAGRLDRKAIYRYKYDSNIFYNNTYKTLENDLAFGIILDESGSMSGKGIENGRTTMIVLHETLKALGINHCIIGHTSEGQYHSEISRYQSFKEDKTYSVCKNYAIVKTTAKSGNCDSGALYYMEKAFERVRNKDKICLIFSDGAPTECTGADLKNQVRHMERKGIKVIGIGINFPSIAKYYTDYANGRNLTDMLNIVSKILEEYVLKKKDK